MGCIRGVCSADKIFIFINIAFAMYSGALLATAARLAWDPSTYTWFRFLCQAQYRVSSIFVLTTGLWLAGLVYLAAAAAHRPATTCLHIYSIGVVCLAVSEIAYCSWMVTTMVSWWRTAPQAALARHGIDMIHDIKPALLAVERYRDYARPIYDMIEEVERQAPNNAYVVAVFGILAVILQVAAFIMARKLARRAKTCRNVDALAEESASICRCGREKRRDSEVDTDIESGDTPTGWRKKANLRMYTILDKIF